MEKVVNTKMAYKNFALSPLILTKRLTRGEKEVVYSHRGKKTQQCWSRWWFSAVKWFFAFYWISV